jgi:histidinol-phosphate aminotransferase
MKTPSRTIDRPHHGGLAWEHIGRSIRDLGHFVPADVNDVPFPPAPAVLSALTEALAFVQWAPDTWADGLQAAIARAHDLPVESVAIDAGSSPLINRAIELAVRGPGEVILLAPTYSEYQAAVRRQGADAVSVCLRPELGFVASSEGIASRVTDKTLAIVLCNPNNPTGTALGRSELISLLEHIPQCVSVIVDEVYADFASNISVLDQVRSFPNLCVVRSFSKGYALAGLRVGFAVLGGNFSETWYRGGEIPWRVGLLADVAARAALGSIEYYDRQIGSLLAERDNLRTRVEREVGCMTWPTQTHFFMLQPPGNGSADSWLQRLADPAVHIKTVAWAGQPNHRPFFRITTRSPAENDRILSALLGWR